MMRVEQFPGGSRRVIWFYQCLEYSMYLMNVDYYCLKLGLYLSSPLMFLCSRLGYQSSSCQSVQSSAHPAGCLKSHSQDVQGQSCFHASTQSFPVSFSPKGTEQLPGSHMTTAMSSFYN